MYLGLHVATGDRLKQQNNLNGLKTSGYKSVLLAVEILRSVRN